MKITYLGHSGFLAETKEHYLLFDYYTGRLPVFLPEKYLTVFVSHGHQDHYNKEIFALQGGTGVQSESSGRSIETVRSGKNKDRQSGQRDSVNRGRNQHITYILSQDIRRKQASELVRDSNELLFVKARETYSLYGDKMTVETLRSTDIGVAFIVEVVEENKTYRFYHAGDLNLWKWEGGTKAHNNNMEANYRREMALLKGQHFDAAFVPLDPRLERFAFGGMDIFLETAAADTVFPMHFWKQPEIIGKYLSARPQVKNLILLKKEGVTYEL